MHFRIRWILTLALPLATPVWAANHVVTVGGSGLVFTPNTLNIAVGDTVTFTNAGGFHNVDSYGTSVTTFKCSSDCSSNNMPSSNAWSSTMTFNTPGTVTFHCDIHGSVSGNTCTGMCGSLTVGTTPVELQSFEVGVR